MLLFFLYIHKIKNIVLKIALFLLIRWLVTLRSNLIQDTFSRSAKFNWKQFWKIARSDEKCSVIEVIHRTGEMMIRLAQLLIFFIKETEFVNAQKPKPLKEYVCKDKLPRNNESFCLRETFLFSWWMRKIQRPLQANSSFIQLPENLWPLWRRPAASYQHCWYLLQRLSL